MAVIPVLREFMRLLKRRDGIEMFRDETTLYSRYFSRSKGLTIGNRINSFLKSILKLTGYFWTEQSDMQIDLCFKHVSHFIFRYKKYYLDIRARGHSL